MRKITSLLMLCLVCIGLSAQTATTKMEVPVKDLSQLSNGAKYFIQSERCFLLYDEAVGQTLATSNATYITPKPAKDLNNKNQLFEIRNEGGSYYLYSVGAGKYVTSNGKFADTPNGELAIQTGSYAYPWFLKIGGNGINTQDPNQMGEGVVVNSWVTKDPGNQFQIFEIEETIEHTGWTVTAFSEAGTSGNEGGVGYVLDVNGETFYHSSWGDTYADGTADKLKGQDGVQGIMIELPANCTINKLSYAGRSDRADNWASQVRVYVYETLPEGITTNLSSYSFTEKEAKFGKESTYLGTPAFENSSDPWANNRATKNIEFATPVTGKYILFLADANTGTNGYFTCSYLNILGEYSEDDPIALPVVSEGEFYTFECLSSNAHSDKRYICDNGSVIDGQSATPSTFSFETAGGGKFYMKSSISGKYINHSDANGIYASDDKVTAWTISKPDHTPSAVTLTFGDDKYLNNNGSDCTDSSTTNLKANYHAGGPGAGNACSLWTLKVAVSEAAMGAVLSLAEQALAAKGVGYPTADCAERTPLTEATANANADKTSKEYYETLVAALTAFAATENVQMPEDGKAYTFTNVQKNGTKYYWHYDASGVTMSSNASDATVYVCKVLDNGKYAFVNNEGKFMIFKGTEGNSSDNGQNDNKGYIDAYDATYADLTIAKLAGPKVTPDNPADVFGFVSINGHREEGNEKNGCHVIKKDGNFDMADGAFFNDNFSSAFQLVEAEFPNKPLANNAQGVEGVAAISTFCAPFATVAPNNVEVYIAASDESHYIKLEKVEGAVPANTGVVLVSTDDAQVGKAVTMVPATTEELADVTGNLLRGDAANGDYAVDAAVNAYVLGSVDGVAGFYPLSTTDRTIKQGKAYLELDASLSAVKLYFGGDEATGIETVVKENANAPIFDLSGRRVVNVAKGGIYIQNGKKFIVK